MTRTQILIGILLVAAIVILLRTVFQVSTGLWGSSVREGFVAPKAVNTTTVCPAGAKMYMYEGGAYCCDGRINKEAPSLTGTCRPASSAPNATVTFCALGAGNDWVPNCLETRAGKLAEEGASTCPPQMMNFAKGPKGSATEKGRCCEGALNAESTDCMTAGPGSFCDVAGAANEFEGGPGSCEFLRVKAADKTPCPNGMRAFVLPGQGALDGLSLFGCSDNSQICYSAALISRLGELGYSTTGMTACSAAAAPTPA
jgi:hypothetical protein